MRRIHWLLVLPLFAGSCTLPPETIPVQPLPQNGQADYAGVVTRARLQAGTATEAFYVDKWSALEDAAKALKESAALLAKSTDVPAKQKDKLAANAAELAKEADQLREAAKAQDVQRSNETLQRIHLKVRELRPEAQ
jgi:hypothetical protein